MSFFQVTDIIAIFPHLILVSGALIILILQISLPRYRTESAFIISIIAVTISTLISIFGLSSEALVSIFGQGASGLTYSGFLIGFDKLSKISAFSGHTIWNAYSGLYVFGILSCLLLTLLFTPKILKDINLNLSEAYQMILYTGAGLLFFVTANNLIMIFIGLELASLPLFVLAAWDRKNKSANEAGMKYFLLGVFSVAFLLLGSALLYGASGSMNLLDINGLIEGTGISTDMKRLYSAGLILVLVGIGFKVALFPFHGWVADVYEGSLTIVTAFMAGLVKIASVSVFYKLMILLGKPMGEPIMLTIIILSVLSMFYGNFTALVQTNIKRMFAFSSISHAGYMAALFVIPNTSRTGYLIHAEASGSLFFYAWGYALGSILVFGVIAYLENITKKNNDRVQITFEDLKGLSKRNPISAFLLSMGSLSFAGIPPLVGFYGKFYLLRVLFKENEIFLALMVTINSLIGVYYYARVVFNCYWDFEDEKSEEKSFAFKSVSAWISGISLGILILIIGIFSDFIVERAMFASLNFR
ncbi:MAG: NADH-quinone oxidoreductase subunit N [Spirochaetia bacterium]|nr:NADH-quinone oxidoreductase subunit N [Spirochaetia bacterium]